jgi:ribosomal protein S18 acetylase RimI-like enzyme
VHGLPDERPPADVEGRLQRPIWLALTGAHAAVAHHAPDGAGRVAAARYDPEVGPFGAVAAIGDTAGWDAMATLVRPGGSIVIMVEDGVTDAVRPWPPAGWAVTTDLPGVQMVAVAMEPAVDPEATPLGPGDVPEMLDLVSRTRPGPFGKRTIELGGYVGFRDGGRLVAMAGRRFAAGGFTEISAVCTDADRRGRGLAGRLVRTVAAGIVAEGAVPFLHAAATNTGAIALYEKLGMTVSRAVHFIILEAAGHPEH